MLPAETAEQEDIENSSAGSIDGSMRSTSSRTSSRTPNRSSQRSASSRTQRPSKEPYGDVSDSSGSLSKSLSNAIRRKPPALSAHISRDDQRSIFASKRVPLNLSHELMANDEVIGLKVLLSLPLMSARLPESFLAIPPYIELAVLLWDTGGFLRCALPIRRASAGEFAPNIPTAVYPVFVYSS
jgi:hypothetical protein